MAFSGLLHLPWRLVVQAGVFLALAVGGTLLVVRLQLQEVERLLSLVIHDTAVMETELKETTTLVTHNNTILERHEDLTAENRAMYDHLVPLFQDIRERQLVILREHAEMQAQCVALLHALQAHAAPHKEP